MTQTSREIFDEWGEAFLKVIDLMGEKADPYTAPNQIAVCLEDDREWYQIGAYDGRTFYNDVAGNAEHIEMIKDEERLARFFYLKYMEWSRPSVTA